MKRFILIALAALFLFPFRMDAQLSTASIDPEADSLAFREMRKKMDKIRRTEHRPTVGLVLSGGGAKGAAHIGALKRIEELDIPVDLVVGTSMGGLMGGMYALGYDAQYLDSLLKHADWSIILSDKVPQKYISYQSRQYKETYALAIPFMYSKDVFMKMTGQDPESEEETGKKTEENRASAPKNNLARSLPAGYISGLNVNDFLSSLSAGYQDSIKFCDLPIPYCCVASDMVTSKAKNWTSGSIVNAMRSTMSIPVMFDPVRTDGMILVDGGTRNNFPTDLAREMGADYIIGVELSDQDPEYNDINNVADILMKFIDMLGSEAFSKNIDNTNVFIKPDLNGYNMLSFSEENISTIIDRGYEAAVRQDSALLALKAKVPNAGRKLRSEPADDLLRQEVQIWSLEFEGLKDKESRYLANNLKFKAGDRLTKSMIEDAVAFIYSTGAFESVSYKFVGPDEPYKLVFDCKKCPVHQFGIGVRADNETMFDLIVNVGLNAHKIGGSKLDVTGKLGQNKYAYARYSLTGPKIPTINADAKIADYSGDFEIENTANRVDYWFHEENVYISNAVFSKFDFNLGAKYEYYGTKSWLSEGEPLNISNELATGGFASAFASLSTNSLNDRYLPMKGMSMDIKYKWVFHKKDHPEFHPEHIASFSMKDVFSMGGRASFYLGLDARAILNGDNGEYKDAPFMNFIGGDMRGRYFSQQVPFIGFGNAMMVEDLLAAAELGFRFRFGKNLYTTLAGGAFLSSDNLSNLLSRNATQVAGASLELAYKTIVGPIRADIRWNTYDKKVSAYLSFGYDF